MVCFSKTAAITLKKHLKNTQNTGRWCKMSRNHLKQCKMKTNKWNAQNHEQLTTTAVFCCNKQIQNNHLFRTCRARDRAWYCIRGLRPRSPITTTAALPLFPIIFPLPITKQNHLFLSLLTPNFFFGKLGWLSSKDELIFDTRKDRKLLENFKGNKTMDQNLGSSCSRNLPELNITLWNRRNPNPNPNPKALKFLIW